MLNLSLSMSTFLQVVMIATLGITLISFVKPLSKLLTDFLKGEPIDAHLRREMAVWGLCSVIALTGFFIFKSDYYSTLYNMANSGYTVYLDGQEVDVDTISFSQYRISVNDDNKSITLADKNERSGFFFFLPLFR